MLKKFIIFFHYVPSIAVCVRLMVVCVATSVQLLFRLSLHHLHYSHYENNIQYFTMWGREEWSDMAYVIVCMHFMCIVLETHQVRSSVLLLLSGQGFFFVLLFHLISTLSKTHDKVFIDDGVLKCNFTRKCVVYTFVV